MQNGACTRARVRCVRARCCAAMVLAPPELSEAEVAKAPPGLNANTAPQDWCDPDSSEEELGADMDFMDTYTLRPRAVAAKAIDTSL